MRPEESITIPITEYESLIKDAFFLQCLESGGVDNWEGYEEAIEILNKEYPEDVP